jgi:hypothetical protein
VYGTNLRGSSLLRLRIASCTLKAARWVVRFIRHAFRLPVPAFNSLVHSPTFTSLHNSPASVFSPTSRPLDGVRFRRKFAPEARPRSTFRDLTNGQRSWDQCLGLEHPALAHSPPRFEGAFPAQDSCSHTILSDLGVPVDPGSPNRGLVQDTKCRRAKLPHQQHTRLLEIFARYPRHSPYLGQLLVPELGQGCPCFQIRHEEAFGRIRTVEI